MCFNAKLFDVLGCIKVGIVILWLYFLSGLGFSSWFCSLCVGCWFSFPFSFIWLFNYKKMCNIFWTCSISLPFPPLICCFYKNKSYRSRQRMVNVCGLDVMYFWLAISLIAILHLTHLKGCQLLVLHWAFLGMMWTAVATKLSIRALIF